MPGCYSAASVRRKLLSQLVHLGQPSTSKAASRRFHDYIRGPAGRGEGDRDSLPVMMRDKLTEDAGTYRVPLSQPRIVGIATSRGSRETQEDAYGVHALQLAPGELKLSLEKHKRRWDPSKAGSDTLAGQVAFFGVYDGHGGREVSTFLEQNLHSLIERVESGSIEEVVSYTKSHGGYFKRWRGGGLHRWTKYAHAPPPADGRMTLEERLTLAFLQADREILETIPKSGRSGSTCTIALLHSLDEPAAPYWSADRVSLTIGHCGDTRALLCHRPTGEVVVLTETHHAEARVEAQRLRRLGAGNLVSDSFGETRWMGAIENTRGLGDGEWKASGVTAEPEILNRVLKGGDYAYLILLTDGLSSLMSDQEIVDLARNALDPTRAAKAIVHFCEDLGAQDNCTCIVVPLAGWGKVGGEDTTEERREYRRRQAGMMNTRMQRM